MQRDDLPKAPDGYPYCLVSYFDVLGAGAKMKSGTRASVKKLLDDLRKIPKFSLGILFSDDDERDPHIQIQDGVFRVTEIGYMPGLSEEEMFQVYVRAVRLYMSEMVWLMNMILRFMRERYVIRGALTVGSAEIDGNSAVGPAVVDAVHGEQDVAKVSRILVSDMAAAIWAAADDAKKTIAPSLSREWIRKDSDGLWFVDYLAVAYTECQRPDHYWELLCEHHHLVADLADNMPKDKGEWLIQYHNDEVRGARGVLPPHRYDVESLLL